MGASEITFPVTTALVKELNFKGSFRYGVRYTAYEHFEQLTHYML